MLIVFLSVWRLVWLLFGGLKLDELFLDGREYFDFSYFKKFEFISWEVFFLCIDKILYGV